MKILKYGAVLFVVAAVGWAFYARPVEREYTLSRSGESLRAAYDQSGNAFAETVSNALRNHYPSRVMEATVKVRVGEKPDPAQFSLAWTATIMSCDAREADLLFVQWSTIASGQSFDDTKRIIGEELKRTQHVALLTRSLAAEYAARPHVMTDASRDGPDDQNRFWRIESFFFALPGTPAPQPKS